MKKQRMVAVFLCLMLVVTAFPMLAMAAETTYDTMDAVVKEFAKFTDYNSYAYWSMTEKISSGTPGFTYTPHNATIDPEKGTYIDSSDTSKMFRYVQEQYWSPLETNKRFVYFKAQVSETDKMEIYVEDAQGLHQHGSFTISATEFNETNFGGLYSAREGGAGTGMNEYLIINDYPAIVKLFVKGEITDGKWALAANANGWTGNNENRGLYFTGTGWVKDVTLYEKTVTYESLEEIAGATLYSMPSYEKDTETTTATGERYTGTVGPAVEEGMVPVFRAKLDDETSSMRVSIRKPGETAATAISYEFTVAPEVITSNAPLTYLNGEFQAGTDYVEYALFATTTECKVYARSDNQFDGKWVHVLTDTTAYSTDTSYSASPAIWAMTGSFTVQNLKIYQTLEGYDTIEEVVGFDAIPTRRFDLTQKITDTTGFAGAPTGATVDAENGTLIDFEVSNGLFRYNNGQEYWSSLETGKRFAYFTAKAYEDQELEVLVQNVDGRPSRGSFKISATKFSESGFSNDTEYSREGGAGTDWVEYLLVSTNANYVNLYAKSPSLTDDKWALACVASGWAGSTEKNNGLYFSGKGYVKDVVLYGTAETYESLDEIAGEELYSNEDYENNTETTVAEGERYTAKRPISVEEGMVSVFRAKLTDAASSMWVIMRRPGETEVNGTCYDFTISADAITSDRALIYLNEEFKAGTDYVEYALFATKTECKVFARAENQFDGKWVHILTDTVAYTTDTSYYATPAIRATTGSFTVENSKIYEPVPPVVTYDSIDSILGFSAGIAQDYDLTTSDYGKTEETDAAVEQGVGLHMNGGRWRFGENGSSSLGADKAIYFRAKAESGKSTYIHLHVPNPTNDTESEAAYTIMLSENGIGTSDNNTHKQYCYEVVKEHVEFIPGTDFAEYLAVDKEDGTGLHIYARKDDLYDGKWVKTAKFVGSFPTLSKSSEFYMTTSGTLAAVTTYKQGGFSSVVDEAETIPAGAANLYFEDDFSGKREYRKTMLYASVDAGNLVVSPTEESSGYGVYEALRTSIPVGGYAELKVLGNTQTGIILSDGTSVLTIGADGITTSTPSIPVGEGGTSYWIWRIVRNTDGSYNGYCCPESGTVWYKAFENAEPTAQEGNTRIALIQYGVNKVAKMDYLKVFAPLTATEEITLIDGMGNNPMSILDGTATPSYATMTALVKQGETEKVLVIAEYDDLGILRNVVTEEVPSGSGVTSLIHDVKTKTAKVFLWDGFSHISNLVDGTIIKY